MIENLSKSLYVSWNDTFKCLSFLTWISLSKFTLTWYEIVFFWKVVLVGILLGLLQTSPHSYARKHHKYSSEIQCTDESLILGFKDSHRRTKDRWNLGRTLSCTWVDARGAVESGPRECLSLEQLSSSTFSTDRTGEGSVHLLVENNFNFFGFFFNLQLQGSCSTSMQKGTKKALRFSPEMSSVVHAHMKGGGGKSKPTKVKYLTLLFAFQFN